MGCFMLKKVVMASIITMISMTANAADLTTIASPTLAAATLTTANPPSNYANSVLISNGKTWNGKAVVQTVVLSKYKAVGCDVVGGTSYKFGIRMKNNVFQSFLGCSSSAPNWVNGLAVMGGAASRAHGRFESPQTLSLLISTRIQTATSAGANGVRYKYTTDMTSIRLNGF